jgi:hypothetical protein
LRCDVVTSTGASRIIGRAVGRLDLHFYVAHPVLDQAAEGDLVQDAAVVRGGSS